MVITLEFCTYTNKDHNLNTTFLFFPFFSQLKNKFLIISSLDWIQFLVFESFSIINSLSCTQKESQTLKEHRVFLMEVLLLTDVFGQVTEHFCNRPHISWNHQSILNKFLIMVEQWHKIRNHSFVSACTKLDFETKVTIGEDLFFSLHIIRFVLNYFQL